MLSHLVNMVAMVTQMSIVFAIFSHLVSWSPVWWSHTSMVSSHLLWCAVSWTCTTISVSVYYWLTSYIRIILQTPHHTEFRLRTFLMYLLSKNVCAYKKYSNRILWYTSKLYIRMVVLLFIINYNHLILLLIIIYH